MKATLTLHIWSGEFDPSEFADDSNVTAVDINGGTMEVVEAIHYQPETGLFWSGEHPYTIEELTDLSSFFKIEITA